MASLECGIQSTCMRRSKGKVLVVSRNPSLAKVRKAILEGAGFTVIAATDDKAVGRAYSDGIELILLGYSVTPSDRRRVWAKSRQYRNVPILELRKGGAPELLERNAFAHESKRAHEFLKSVRELPGGKRLKPSVTANRSTRHSDGQTVGPLPVTAGLFLFIHSCKLLSD